MTLEATIALAAFAAVSSLLLLVYLVVGGRKSVVETRMDELAGRALTDAGSVRDLARSTLPRFAAPLMPKDEESRTRLQSRLIHAGLYSRQALIYFLGIKMVLIVAPVVAGLVLGILGVFPLAYGLIGGCCFGIVGVIGPSFWLDWRKRARQRSFRRALPDALDILVICLEGGLSLTGAFRRVAEELRTAHPLLATELNIVQREIQLGRSTGDALRQFSVRADLEEIRTLSSVIVQTERFGAGLVRALRVHAETLRDKRLQAAEEMAQKAATKILFPTVIFILPAVFLVILGPGFVQIWSVLGEILQPK